MDKASKGMVVLPSIPIDTNARVGANRCFMISKGEDGKESRQMKFLDNEQNLEFKLKIANTIYNKMYIEGCQRKRQPLDAHLVAYFNNPHLTYIDFKGQNLNEEHKILNLFDAVSFHPKL